MADTGSKKFFRSFRYAWRGVIYAFKTELSFRIHVFIGFLVVVLSLLLNLTDLERIILYLLIGFVLILEIINTIFERIVDALEPRISPVAEAVKDMMAAAVFIVALVAAIVGLMIFIPALLNLI